MTRVLISVSPAQIKKLDILARRSKKSRSQLVREAVHLYIEQRTKKQDWEVLVRKTAAIWKPRNTDATTYLAQLRDKK